MYRNRRKFINTSKEKEGQDYTAARKTPAAAGGGERSDFWGKPADGMAAALRGEGACLVGPGFKWDSPAPPTDWDGPECSMSMARVCVFSATLPPFRQKTET